MEKLRAAGISVEVVDHAPSRALNPFFAHWITSDRPYVILKLAQSLDGKITAPGRRFISNKKSREKVHQLRAQVSAVLTTTETVFADSPKLTARPVNISRAFSDPDVVMVGERTVPPNFELFKNKDRNYHQFRREDLQAILEKCTQRGIDSLLTEAGAQVCTELLRRDLADEVQLFVAPQIFGKGKNAFNGSFDLKNFHLAEWENLDGDVWMRFIRVPRPAETGARRSGQG
ncbi:MAG: RibD family protein [Candidatus Gracilibacteria bacterium]|nr:RibD family protein [Candidatus Gracilibacteria bacterium]